MDYFRQINVIRAFLRSPKCMYEFIIQSNTITSEIVSISIYCVHSMHLLFLNFS